MSDTLHDNTPDDLHGFDPKSVTWGYQHIFARAIEGLLAEGELGEHRRRTTQAFFDLLSHRPTSSFDHALKEFLGALNRRTTWLLELPGMFEDFCEVGRDLSERNLSVGIRFFRLWGEGGFGETPEQLRDLLRHVRRLAEVDVHLAGSFMVGYGELLGRLTPTEIDRFVNHVLEVHHTNPNVAGDFAALRVKSAQTYLRVLSQEARLEDMSDRLGRLGLAVSGRRLHFDDLGALDSDLLLMRGTSVVCAKNYLFMPALVRCCRSRGQNEAIYLLTTLLAAAGLRIDSFMTRHGDDGATDILQWVVGDERLAAMVTTIETARVVRYVRRTMPGARRLIEFGLAQEFTRRPAESQADRLLRACLRESDEGDEHVPPGWEQLIDIADTSADFEHTAALATEVTGLARGAPRAMMIFPDFYHMIEPGDRPPARMVADPDHEQGGGRDEADPTDPPDAMAADATDENDEAGDADLVQFAYPEWNHFDGDYYDDWCLLSELRPAVAAHFHPRFDEQEQEAIQRARRMFERLRPDLARKEKFLSDGDEINVDRLVDYMVTRRTLPAPRVQFYEKTFIQQRDIAVALLMDVSGSTGGMNDNASTAGSPVKQRRIIDIEKQAALILGEGLDALGDPFGLYGFSGNGREHCEFFVYKDLEEPMDDHARRRVMSAFPTANTRIGVALRHTLGKLKDAPARRRIIILITDGRPQDSGYDPATRYAQYDVRMACHECEKHDVAVVCISTLENSRADLEVMFPQRRYVVLEDMSRLPDVLPALYLTMTA